MARLQSKDPLTQLNARFPLSLVERFRREALDRGMTTSDVLRSYLAVTGTELIDGARQRPPKRASDRADPDLLRHLSAMGNNLNQIARSVNRAAQTGAPMNAIEILTVLHGIDQRISQINRAGKVDDAY